MCFMELVLSSRRQVGSADQAHILAFTSWLRGPSPVSSCISLLGQHVPPMEETQAPSCLLQRAYLLIFKQITNVSLLSCTMIRLHPLPTWFCVTYLRSGLYCGSATNLLFPTQVCAGTLQPTFPRLPCLLASCFTLLLRVLRSES